MLKVVLTLVDSFFIWLSRLPLIRTYKPFSLGYTFLIRFIRGRLPLVAYKSADGAEFFLNPLDHVDLQVIKNGYYERSVLNEILHSVGKDETFWDIGANFGLHSLSVAKMRPDVKVLAVEPNPTSAGKLLLALREQMLSVQVVNVALSSKHGLARLSICIDGNSGLSSLSPWPEVTYASSMLAATIEADRLVELYPDLTPTVVKCDVEGHELEVFQGMSELLKGQKLRTIIFENNSDARINEILTQNGFKIEILDSSNLVAKKIVG